MIFSYNWLKEYVKNLPKPERLSDLLIMHSFEVVEVKRVGRDFVLDIDVLSNRASDCFSHLGVARECAAITNSTYRDPTSVKTAGGRASADFVSVEIRSQQACSRYTTKVVTDVKVGPSPKWLRERLKVCGLRPVNNIVDIANYVMLETGQPLHAFDGEKLEGRKILVRFAKKGEKITTLDNQRFNLDPDILVIADAKKPIAIAGIKGGKEPEIDKKTKVVVLESANFYRRAIRKSSKKLNLKTDASWRFEHGLDPNLTEFAINRAVFLIQKVVGGKFDSGIVDVYPKKVYPKKIKLDLNYVESLLGVRIPEKKIKSILKKLGFRLVDLRNPLLVEVPTQRTDVSLPEDLIEEIGRIYGYEKIPAVFPVVSLIPSKRNLDIFWENIVKNILKEAGFTEVYNYSFISEKGGVEVENPVSSEYKYLRPSLIPNLLKNIEKNLRYFSEIKIFELGKVFEGRKEKRQLSGLVVGQDFYYLKGVIDLLLNKLGISNIQYEERGLRVALIKVNGTALGFLKEKVFELDFEKLQKVASEEHQYHPLSKFPSAVRDLAILVPRETKVVEVLNKINAAGGRLVRDIDLFDIYQGTELPQGKKNLAFHIVYQAEDRTLKSEEIDKIHQKIIKTLEKKPRWQVRK